MPCRATVETAGIAPGLYRIIRNTDPNVGACANSNRSSRLFSLPSPSTVEVAQFAHYFKLGVQCSPADIGSVGGAHASDGVFDNNDFIVFIDYFFAPDSRADVGSVGGAYGADGMYDNNDFVVFIDLFFRGCTHPEVCEEAPGPGFAGRSSGGASQAGRELQALQAFFNATGDARVLERLIEATFNADP